MSTRMRARCHAISQSPNHTHTGGRPRTRHLRVSAAELPWSSPVLSDTGFRACWTSPFTIPDARAPGASSTHVTSARSHPSICLNLVDDRFETWPDPMDGMLPAIPQVKPLSARGGRWEIRTFEVFAMDLQSQGCKPMTSGNAWPATTYVRIPHKQPTSAGPNRTFRARARSPGSRNWGQDLPVESCLPGHRWPIHYE